jgi:hypothetical protein
MIERDSSVINRVCWGGGILIDLLMHVYNRMGKRVQENNAGSQVE